MSMMERNVMQMKMAMTVARRKGITILEALDFIKVPFAEMYPNEKVIT